MNTQTFFVSLDNHFLPCTNLHSELISFMSFTISIDDIVHSTLDFVNLCHLVSAKGQIISKGLFGVIVSSKKNNKIFLRISALASKKRSNQKSSVREPK